MRMEITFLGANGTVTGSKYLVTVRGRRVLVDCGLFQGPRELRERNWQPLPVRAESIDAVVLTHAHLDHSGYLPLLVRDGFAGRIFCSPATRDLSGLLLPDSGHLQEEDADHANRHGYSKHKPARPLYTEADARRALDRFTAIDWDEPHYLGAGLCARLRSAGHILGAATVEIDDGQRRVLFSGDLGRPDDPVCNPPAPIDEADYLVVESTYGDRIHPHDDLLHVLGDVIRRTALRGGVVLFPAFAVGRAQALLYYVQRLRSMGAIPDIPVFVDSPMATNATEIYCRYRSEHRLTPSECHATCSAATYVRDAAESRALCERDGPMLVISASGMLTGGRVLHHLKARAPDPRSTILCAGYQGAGTRGAALVAGARTVRLFGEDVSVKAEVVQIEGLSAHADAAQIVDWLRALKTPPRTTFVTHGEPVAAAALSARVHRELGWRCTVPKYLDRVELAPAPRDEPAPPNAPKRAEVGEARAIPCDVFEGRRT